MEPITNFPTQNLNQNITPIIPQRNIFKILFFVLLALFLVVITVLTTILITKNKESILVEETEIKTNIIPTTVSTKIITDEIADWQTYTNSTWKYSIQYPNTWKLTTGLSTLSKDTVSLQTPEFLQAQLERKGNLPSSEPCGFYYISCFKNVSDLDKETTTKSLSDYLISKKGSVENDYSIIDKTTKNNQTTYEVNGGALRLEKYYFIEKSDLSFCKIEMCGSLEKITGTDRQFVDTFKFN